MIESPAMCDNFFCGGNHCGGNNLRQRRSNMEFATTDAELAAEMNALSVQEREKMLEEIHGVRTDHEESPELIADSLKRFDYALTSVHPRKRRAMDRAMFLNPNLRNNKKFNLMFLRADGHDAYKAAKRMAKYYEDKRVVFGEDKLARKITLEDLDENDMSVFEEGSALLLPFTDPTDRPILFFNLSRVDPQKVVSMVRCLWYVVMSAIESEAIQIKGACIIDCFFRDFLSSPAMFSAATNVMKRVGDVIINLPCRATSYHFCYNNSNMKIFIATVRAAMGKEVRLRLRDHCGSTIEIQYLLMSYGIRSKGLFDDSGEPGISKIQQEFFERRRRIEEKARTRRQNAVAERGLIPYPEPKDVLIGRGRPYQIHLGNLLMGQFVDARMEQYHSSDRFEKTCISMNVVHLVHESGGRFLHRTDAGWKILDDNVAREKMASVFRTKAVSKSNSNNSNAGESQLSEPYNPDEFASHDARVKRMRGDQTLC